MKGIHVTIIIYRDYFNALVLCVFCLSPVCTENILNAALLQTTVCNIIENKLEVLSWLHIPFPAAYLLCQMLQQNCCHMKIYLFSFICFKEFMKLSSGSCELRFEVLLIIKNPYILTVFYLSFMCIVF